jgi:hypothetical protein
MVERIPICPLPTESSYYRVTRWITGLPASTRTTKLLRCANLPPLNIWLDYLTTKYAIRILFTAEDHGIRPLPLFDISAAKRPGLHRVLSFVSEYRLDKLEQRSLESPMAIDPVRIHLQKPKNEKEKAEANNIRHGYHPYKQEIT